MIPLNLQIKNFLSYGSELQTINFEPYNLICLSGKNGHGKSALLDAMAWAVWGEARKTTGTSKPDHGLLRLGQRHMIVIFDFEFNKNKYRIRREFTFAYGKPYAYLEFGMFDNSNIDSNLLETNNSQTTLLSEENQTENPESIETVPILNDKIISLTDKTIRATQEKIETMLGLNFESFCNSAFLRQGSSNEFSKKSPKDRKEILAHILGLGKFENLRKVALEKIKQFANLKENNIKLNEVNEKALNLFPEINTKLLETKEQINQLNKNQNHILNNNEILKKEKSEFALILNEFQMLVFQYKKLNEEKATKSIELKNLYNLWQEVHKKKIAFPDKDKLEIQKQELIKKVENFQKLQYKQLDLKESLLKLKEDEQSLFKALNDKQSIEINSKNIELERLLINKSNLHDKIKEINNLYQSYLNENNQLDLEIKNNNLLLNDKCNDIELANNEKQFEKRRNFYQKLIAQGNLIKSELSALEQKKKLSLDDHNPSCPLCEQNLSASRKKFLKQQFSNQEHFLNHRIKRLTGLIHNLKEILLIQHEEIKSYKTAIELNKNSLIKNQELIKSQNLLKIKISDLEIQNKEFNNGLNEFELKINELKKIIEHIKVDGIRLINEDIIYKQIKSEIHDLNVKISEINYNPLEHKDILTKLTDIDQMLNSYKKEDLNLIREQHKIEFLKLINNLRALNSEIKNLKIKIDTYQGLKDQEKSYIDKENEIQNSLNNLLKQKEILLQEQGSLENEKSKLEQLMVECDKNKKELFSLEESIEDYKTISIALSKDGIQALLIEEAIPEIENEANDLLAKLTDNQAQIIIESVRDLKKGGIKETLDIKISDSVGIRPYEMFSGGEAFRIDFALRIAISKLLARRTGTSLQTLIIDEGFGSQDEEGLAHIMDSIYKIQEDFAKIIIVSHLGTMKEQFPVHFIVDKGPSGSKVCVIEQG